MKQNNPRANRGTNPSPSSRNSRQGKPVPRPKPRARKAGKTGDVTSTQQNMVEAMQQVPAKLKLLWLLIVVATTFVSYTSALRNDFTNWDDKSYASENGMMGDMSAENIGSMFFGKNRFYMGNYHPLTMLSLNIDYEINKIGALKDLGASLRGENKKPDYKARDRDPFVFHLMNLLFHLANTVLVFWFVLYLFKDFRVAVIASALFGVSTIHVESVAWVSERKDVLYTFFFLMSLVWYLKFLDKSKGKYLGLSLLWFLLSLLSKGQAVSLAVSLVAIDFIGQRDLRSRKLWLEKAPYFALALVFGLIAVMAQKHGNAIHEIDEYPFYQRIIFASYSVTHYVGKLLFPYRMAAIYPYPQLIGGQPPSWFWWYPLPATLIVGMLLVFWKWNKNMAFGLAFFFINIVLLLQFLPVGSAIMSDRYAYVPSIGIFIVLAFGAKQLYEKSTAMRMPVLAAVALYCAVMGYKTYEQNKLWKDSVSLWENTVRISPTALVAWNNMGSARDKSATGIEGAEKVRIKESAIHDFTKAIELKPDYSHALYNRGTAKKDLERWDDAIEDFNKALEADEHFGEAYHNRGICYESKGELNTAIADYNRGIELKPDEPNLYSSRGVVQGKMSESLAAQVARAKQLNNLALADSLEAVRLNLLQKAVDDFNKAVELSPMDAKILSNRGLAMDKFGQQDKALDDYAQAIAIDPKFTTAYANRAMIYRQRKQYDKALADYTAAIQSSPYSPMPYCNRAKTYIEMGQYENAFADFGAAIQVAPNYSAVYIDIGFLYLQQKKRDAACQSFLKAKSMGDRYADYQINRYCK